jgi:Protein of unknown function (DUF2808)
MISSTIANLFLLSRKTRSMRAVSLALSMLSFVAIPAIAIPQGQTTFTHSPRLIRAATSHNGAGASSTYQFTLSVPKDAGAPIKAVKVTQQSGSENIMFDVSESLAFNGDSFAGGTEVPLASIGGEESSQSGEITVEFDRPIPPGSTVTVALKVKRNPALDGIYSFGVTAYPPGENSQGLFLGDRDLHFDEN